MNLEPIRELALGWRETADTLRGHGADGPAKAVERCAADLEAKLREWWREPLGVEEAADELGVSYDAMQKRISRGTYVNVGTAGAPRVRRCDLHGGPVLEETGASDIRAALDRTRGDRRAG